MRADSGESRGWRRGVHVMYQLVTPCAEIRSKLAQYGTAIAAAGALFRERQWTSPEWAET